uniref:FACT complex subunit n=1 Tax=Aegilops tauschii TaxID=37682 RepID=M8BBC7_AEGTA
MKRLLRALLGVVLVLAMAVVLLASRERNDYPPSFPFVQSYHGFGNKKTKDVQFYVEVMDVVQTVGGTRRSALDLDEIEEEQRERDWKNRINM